MEKSSLPKLPWGLEPKLLYWTNDGRTLQIQADDEKCVYLFKWDGVSVSFDKMSAYIKQEIL